MGHLSQGGCPSQYLSTWPGWMTLLADAMFLQIPWAVYINHTVILFKCLLIIRRKFAQRSINIQD